MALIGLGSVTLVALVCYVRSARTANKVGVAFMWLVTALILSGVIP